MQPYNNTLYELEVLEVVTVTSTPWPDVMSYCVAEIYKVSKPSAFTQPSITKLETACAFNRLIHFHQPTRC
jgi:hypothetical protein